MQGKKHIHLIGICGTAMASMAGLLQLKGHRVTGSDQAAYPPMSDLLQRLNILVAEPFSEKNLEPRPDLVIVGNAMSRGNVELEYVLDQRIPFASLAQVIHEEFVTWARITRCCRDSRQDYDDEYACVDLRGCLAQRPRTGTVVSYRRRRGKLREQLSAAGRRADDS